MAGFLLFLPGLALQPAADLPTADPHVLDVPADGMFRGTLSGGKALASVPVRIHISPDMPIRPFLTAGAAEAAGLVGAPVEHAISIGPLRVMGTPSTAFLSLGGESFERGVTWFDAPMVEGADVAVGPADLPYGQVRFRLRPARPGERRLSFPVVRENLISTVVRFRIGRQEVRLGFAPDRPTSVATAAAGALLAGTNGAAIGERRDRVRLVAGRTRPVRAMRLARPLSIEGLQLRDLMVRTRDFGGETGLPGLDAPGVGGNSEEVVVTARGQASPAIYYIMLGADLLAPCSSITFDNRRRRVVLSCFVS